MGRGKRTSRAGKQAAKATESVQERFAIEPAYKQARVWHVSNPTGMVKDGYLLKDTLTGAVKRVQLKKDAAREIERVLSREAELDWSQVASWSATIDSRAPSGLMEVYGQDSTGRNLGQIALAARSHKPSETRANVRRWLAAKGHPDLPELVR